jgi:hypothetical protein
MAPPSAIAGETPIRKQKNRKEARWQPEEKSTKKREKAVDGSAIETHSH